jgi:hypothetical protein
MHDTVQAQVAGRTAACPRRGSRGLSDGSWIVGRGLSVYMLRHPEQDRGPLRQRLLRAQDLSFDTKMTIWTGIVGFLANLIVATVLNPLFRRLPHGHDETARRLRDRRSSGANRGRPRTSPPRYVTGRD